ncbi:hypothetical protein BY458DRAFT_496058 [Sporodiniella umbellata]|nr:hypothetical protein BY458DRAFT_496058 [Sporodiniella umbellata]
MKLLPSLILFYFPFTYATTHVMIFNETFHDRMAAFGPKLPFNGKLGFLAEPTIDSTGCSIEAPPCTEWVALVKRGGCSFISKVRAMQQSGAIAVVVGDSEKSGWITMLASGDTLDITIPSVFLAKNDYNRLLHLLNLLRSPLTIVLQSDENVWPSTDIFFIVLLSPCVMMLFIYVSWKIRQGVKRRKQLASASAVSKLSVKIFREKQNQADSCSICLEEYEEGSELRVLPCHHQFHAPCVDAWLMTKKKLCPICKRDITLNSDFSPLLLEEGSICK